MGNRVVIVHANAWPAVRLPWAPVVAAAAIVGIAAVMVVPLSLQRWGDPAPPARRSPGGHLDGIGRDALLLEKPLLQWLD